MFFRPWAGAAYNVRVTRVYRSLPKWLARDYLVELEGKASSGDFVYGVGWQAFLHDGDSIAIGAVHVGQIHVEFEGDDARVPQVIAAFERKALRAGG